MSNLVIDAAAAGARFTSFGAATLFGDAGVCSSAGIVFADDGTYQPVGCLSRHAAQLP